MPKRIELPKPRKISITDAISEAFGVFEELASEMRDWANNLEEKFSATERYSRVSEAAEALEGFSEPDVDEVLQELEVTIQDPKPSRRARSRATRCGEACSILDACISELESYAASDDADFDEANADIADSLRDELENAKSDAEGVEFPGTYG